MRRSILTLFALTLMAGSAHAAGKWDVIHASTLYIGGEQTTFPQGAKVKTQFEGFGALAVSLSPHISATGSLAQGFQDNYTRASAGARFTLHDNVDHTVSAGVGIERQWCSDLTISHEEWVGKSVIGWDAQKWLNLVGTGAYGLTSHEMRASIGAEFPITALH